MACSASTFPNYPGCVPPHANFAWGGLVTVHPVENVNQDVRLPHLASGLRLHIDMGRAAMGWIVGELLPTQPQQQVFVVQASGLAPLFVTNGTAELVTPAECLESRVHQPVYPPEPVRLWGLSGADGGSCMGGWHFSTGFWYFSGRTLCPLPLLCANWVF